MAILFVAITLLGKIKLKKITMLITPVIIRNKQKPIYSHVEYNRLQLFCIDSINLQLRNSSCCLLTTFMFSCSGQITR